ncbi:Nitrogen assimilation regulatory protein [bacterium HR18]|nr:Nitrogen assimilation regulatory protein [bacterium HR18]
MRHAQTIALARSLLAEGRSREVARMLEPLISPLPENPAAAEPSQYVMRALLARVRLLRQGAVEAARVLLGPLADLPVRERLSPELRAEIALWLGWRYAWPDASDSDPARAFNLFVEAERHFTDELRLSGHLWVRIGQALAYLTIDEYSLALQALDEAAALKERLPDLEADVWIHDLRVQSYVLTGRYRAAQRHLEQLTGLVEQLREPLLQGRAAAYRALLEQARGGSPATTLEAAEAAEAWLGGPEPTYLCWQARSCWLATLRRTGQWTEAHHLAQRWLATSAGPAAHPVRLEAAQLALLQEDAARSADLIAQVLTVPCPTHPRLYAARAALLESQRYLQSKQPERAREWAERAYQAAHELRLEPLILEALLLQARIALASGNAKQAQSFLHQAETFGDYFSLLPWAAHRFWLLAELARAEARKDEARVQYVQALSAFSLLTDRYHTARLQLEVARLTQDFDPAQARALLEAAAQVFAQLGVETARQEAQNTLLALPHHPIFAVHTPEAQFGAALAHAALSVDLVAETWLQVLEQLWPGRWLAVYRYLPGTGWQALQHHGELPATLTFPHPDQATYYTQQAAWLRLRPLPGVAFFTAAAVTPEERAAWQTLLERLKPWLPVVTLAFEHALLRANRLGEAGNGHAPETAELPSPLPELVYASSALRALIGQIYRIRSSHSPVLITGESGTGKELIARAIHATSDRRHAPFVAFNCANVPPELIDSHLFGHEKGAFTGALQANPGVIRAAEGGTLFLDEIGDLPLEVQPKLLRFLQEGEIFPLGARRPLRVNVRVIAATHQNLEELVRRGAFREDLYYRLNVIPLHVPPLRERREDIPVLVRHFLNTLRPPGAPAASITARAMEALLRYNWPGNVRQLRNEIERALAFVASEPAPLIDLKDLSPTVQQTLTDTPAHLPILSRQTPTLEAGQPLEAVLAGTEKALIERVLAEHRGRISAAARSLGLTRQGLYKKMKRLGINPARFQQTAVPNATASA